MADLWLAHQRRETRRRRITVKRSISPVEVMLKLQRERSVSARRHAVSGELIGAGNEVRDRGILITESNQFHETKLAIPPSLPSFAARKTEPVHLSLSFPLPLLPPFLPPTSSAAI